MKRTIALVIALTMILALAACGGNDKKNSNSSSTPAPATQPEQTTPASTPVSEPAPEQKQEPAANQEPAQTSGDLPDGAYYLYDGEHYLTANNFDTSNPSYTAISGTKGSKDAIAITAQKSDGTDDIVIVTLVKDGIIKEQTNALPETIMENPLEPGKLLGYSPLWLYNPTDSEIVYQDAQLAYYASRDYKNVTIDGKLIDTVDAVIDALGTPTAAYGSAYLEAGNGEASICYIWLYEDLLVAIETGAGFQGGQTVPFIPANFFHGCVLSDGILQEIEATDDVFVKSGNVIRESINTLKTLGLL